MDKKVHIFSPGAVHGPNVNEASSIAMSERKLRPLIALNKN